MNLFFPSGAPKSYVNQVHLRAWKEGLKGLYYLRTEAKQRAENVSEKVERVALAGDMRTIVYSKKDCPFCSMAMEELKLRGIPYDKIDLKERTATLIYEGRAVCKDGGCSAFAMGSARKNGEVYVAAMGTSSDVSLSVLDSKSGKQRGSLWFEGYWSYRAVFQSDSITDVVRSLTSK